MWADGQLLHNGLYRIESTLGRGGFGITYKALHINLNQYVVIKTPDETLKLDPNYVKFVERFIKEGRLLAKLCAEPHPHIVRVTDLFAEGDTHCLVMDFIPGESLWQWVQHHGKLSEPEALLYIRQIGSALQVIHEAGIVHLDVTPPNIMLKENGKAVLIDFGIAAEMAPPSSFSREFGNKSFSPYELSRKGSRHPTVDVYALAASLYYAVTGQCPTKSFDRKYDGEELVSPHDWGSGISYQLNQAILQGMALEAKDRPQSIQAWLDLLPASDMNDLSSEVSLDKQTLPDLETASKPKGTDTETVVVNKEASFTHPQHHTTPKEPPIIKEPAAAAFEKEIFISYAWRGESEEFVNRLDQVFQSQGISIVRDKRDLGYKGLIKEFMERIGRGKCVIVVISDRYLKSPNCMYELVQIAKSGEFYNRIFPIVLADAKIYNPVDRADYIIHWEEEIDKLQAKIKQIKSFANLPSLQRSINEYTEIRATIDGLTDTLQNMNTLTPDIHSESDFNVLINAIQQQVDT